MAGQSMPVEVTRDGTITAVATDIPPRERVFARCQAGTERRGPGNTLRPRGPHDPCGRDRSERS